MIRRLRAEVDALFVPMSFGESDRPNMEMAFPSKLADYTATGLPLLVYGPAYCSAVRWVHDNPGLAEVVEVEAPHLLAQAIKRLEDASYREGLGQRALGVGRRYFTHDVAQGVFDSALGRHTNLADGCTQ